MSFVKNVLRDLIEKKLWPIAAGLVALLVAVPLALGGGGGGSSKPAPTADTSPATTAQAASDEGVVAAVDTVDAAPKQRSRPGKLRDPFVQPKVKAPQTTGPQAPSTQASGGGSAAAGSAASSAASGSAGSGVHITLPPLGSTPKSATPKPDLKDVRRVTLRFGEATKKLKTYDNVARLTPLPSVTNPFFVFLGVLADGKTATFLVDSDATPTGDGVCRPSKADCETIELKAGDTEFFDLQDAAGKPVQYELDLQGIRKVKRTATVAAAAYARKSVAGQELVRTVAVSEGSRALRAYHFRPADGLLVRARRAPGARAASGEAPFRWNRGEVAVFRSLPRSTR